MKGSDCEGIGGKDCVDMQTYRELLQRTALQAKGLAEERTDGLRSLTVLGTELFQRPNLIP